MATFEGSITFDYIATGVKDRVELDKRLDQLIDLLSRRSNDLDGVNWDNVNWTAEESADTCVKCNFELDNWDQNPFMRYCDTCKDLD